MGVVVYNREACAEGFVPFEGEIKNVDQDAQIADELKDNSVEETEQKEDVTPVIAPTDNGQTILIIILGVTVVVLLFVMVFCCFYCRGKGKGKESGKVQMAEAAAVDEESARREGSSN